MKKRYIFLFILLYSTSRVHPMDQDGSESYSHRHLVRVICVNESRHCFSISPTHERLLSRSLSTEPTVFSVSPQSATTLMIKKGSYITVAGYTQNHTFASSRTIFIANEGTIITFFETTHGWNMSKKMRRLSFTDSLATHHQPNTTRRDNS